MTTTRQQVREIITYVRTLSPSKASQLAYLSKAQGMVLDNEQHLNILSLVKRRIYRG